MELEKAKHECINKLDFNAPDAFRIFDLNERGFIALSELKDGLGDLGIYATYDDAELIFNRYDRNSDARIEFREFEDAIRPLDCYYDGILAKKHGSHRRVNPYRRNDIFDPVTANAYVHLLRMHLKVEQAAEAMR